MFSRWMFSIVSAFCSAVADFSAAFLVGADLLRMSREDLIQICGPADGIRLFNTMKGRWDGQKGNQTFRPEAEKRPSFQPVSARSWSFYSRKRAVNVDPSSCSWISGIFSPVWPSMCVSSKTESRPASRPGVETVRARIHSNAILRFQRLSVSPQALLIIPLCSLPGSVPGGADPAGPVREDRSAVWHHPAADHTRVPTNPQRDPHTGLWRGNVPAHLWPRLAQKNTHVKHLGGKTDNCSPLSGGAELQGGKQLHPQFHQGYKSSPFSSELTAVSHTRLIFVLLSILPQMKTPTATTWCWNDLGLLGRLLAASPRTCTDCV